MHKSDHGNEPSGVRLVRLINTRALDIARREAANRDRMCLYGTGEYWHGFEHSAYFLSREFPDLESFVLNHPSHPFPIVGVSVPLKAFRRYMADHAVVRTAEDYLEYPATTFAPLDYGTWHRKMVDEYRDVLK